MNLVMPMLGTVFAAGRSGVACGLRLGVVAAVATAASWLAAWILIGEGFAPQGRVR